GYSAFTFTLGGDIAGNCVTGSWVIANIPKNTMIRDITIDKTGLFINLLNMIVLLSLKFYSVLIFKLEIASFGSTYANLIFSPSFTLCKPSSKILLFAEIPSETTYRSDK